jgi:hypothetical protein
MSLTAVSRPGQPMHLRGWRLTAPRTWSGVPERPEWMSDPARACAPEWGMGDLFTSDSKSDLNTAAAICRRSCPFVAQCRAWAVARDERHNVWGGLVLSKEADRGLAQAGPERAA